MGLLLAATPAAVLAGCGSSHREFSAERLEAQSAPSVVKLFGRVGEGGFSGSGVIINATRSLVLTNAHVVAGLSPLKARLNDGTTVGARILASAPCDDIAVVQLVNPPTGLRPMPLGNSSTVHEGQHVNVLGYPGNLEQSEGEGPKKLQYNDGRVSLAKTSASLGPGSITYPDLIQHQAFTNHGNSGGALLDDDGRLLGIPTLTGAEEGGQTQGQYYAVAINHVKLLLKKLESGTSISDVGWNLVPLSRAILDAAFEPTLATKVATEFEEGKYPRGLFVLGSDAGSPARKGSITLGDYITQIEDTPVATVQEVCEAVVSKKPGDTMTVHGLYLTDAAENQKEIGDRWRTDIKVPSQ